MSRAARAKSQNVTAAAACAVYYTQERPERRHTTKAARPFSFHPKLARAVFISKAYTFVIN
jgi:hypothetical protein